MPPLLCNYIRRREVIEFTYDGSLRVVEPHLLGLDESGDLTLSAWQVEGKTGAGWRDFWAAKMSNIAPAGRRFLNARPGYNSHDTTIKTITCRLAAGRLNRRRPGRPSGGRPGGRRK